MAKTPRRGTDWQVGPTLKDKPGSQGTLFRGGSKFSSDKHWPKGYTPERADEVGFHLEDHDVFERPRDPHLASKQFAQVNDAIARSTVPVRHLNRNLQIRVAPNKDFQMPGGTPIPGSLRDHLLGMYTNSANRGQTRPRIQVRPEEVKSETLIHEIGHHVSSTEMTDHSVGFDKSGVRGRESQGKEEAYADDYAAEHFRDKKGRRTVVPDYEFGGRSGDFVDSYLGARKTPRFPEGPAKPEFDEHQPALLWENNNKGVRINPGALPGK